jgi:hypothetical protein
MILLHFETSGAEIFVNPMHIIYAYANNGATHLQLTKTDFRVRETPEQIRELTHAQQPF